MLLLCPVTIKAPNHLAFALHSSKHHRFHLAHGHRRSSLLEIHPCRHSSVPGASGWGTWGERMSKELGGRNLAGRELHSVMLYHFSWVMSKGKDDLLSCLPSDGPEHSRSLGALAKNIRPRCLPSGRCTAWYGWATLVHLDIASVLFREDEGSGLSHCLHQLRRTVITLLSFYRLFPGREWLATYHLPLHTSNYNSCYLATVSQPFSVAGFITEALP